MLVRLARCGLLLLALLLPIAQAQAEWRLLPGDAVGLAASPGGDAYALGRAGEIWHWRNERADWGRISGQLQRIAAGVDGRPWGIDPAGAVLRHNGLWWENLEKRGRDLAIDGNGDVWVLLIDGGIARYNVRRGDWDAMPDAGLSTPARIAVEPRGRVWLLDASGEMRRLDGKVWTAVPGTARELAGGAGGMHCLDANGQLLQWQENGGRWQALAAPEGLVVLAVGAPGTLWAATAGGAIYSTAAPPPQARREARTPLPAGKSEVVLRKARRQRAALIALGGPGRITDSSPIQFSDTRATASALAIGADGSVFALSTAGGLARWSNAQHRFLDFPGNLVKLAVDPAGRPWGVNIFGRLFRHDGSDWRQIRGTGSDIAAAADGKVFVADANAALWQYEPSANGLTRLEGSAVLIAADPAGTLWGLLADGSVVRCAATPCEHLGRKARSIAIGPDGSVFIVTLAGRLERRDVASGDWLDIPVPGHVPAQVAVGPKGRPWLLTSTGKVLAAGFFPRDESGDIATALATRNATTGSGDMASVVSAPHSAGAFVFTKSMRFRTYTTTPNFDGIRVGADGSVFALETTNTLAKFDTRSKTFKPLTAPLPPEVYKTVSSGPDGLLWLLSGQTDGRIFHQRANLSWEVFNLPGAREPCIWPPCTEMNTTLSVGADGAVYVVDTLGALYRKQPDAKAFTRLLNGPFYKVAAGRSGDVWVITRPPAFEVFQVVGNHLEARPPSHPAQAVDIAAGGDGSVYAALYGYDLTKWNPANQSFDKVGRQADGVGVTPDGRPWITDFLLSSDAYMAQ